MPDLLDDFVNASAEQLKYQFSVALHPDSLTAADSELQPLAWESIRYGHDEIDRVPDDKRGIYAFAINCPSDVLPPHSYILYIGMLLSRAGHSCVGMGYGWRCVRENGVLSSV